MGLTDNKDKICVWYYRPATTPDNHFAYSSCGGMKFLSKLIGLKQEVGVADSSYNNRICPQCGRTIEMSYKNLGG